MSPLQGYPVMLPSANTGPKTMTCNKAQKAWRLADRMQTGTLVCMTGVISGRLRPVGSAP